jgi:molybdate transport system regulatory protein
MEKPAALALNLQIRVLQEGAVVMGPGRAELLALIQGTGSIAAAARGMAMSYKRAWALVEALNRAFASPLVEAAKGGAGGGGAKLTATGIEVLGAYESLDADCRAAAAAALDRLQQRLAVSPGGKSA